MSRFAENTEVSTLEQCTPKHWSGSGIPRGAYNWNAERKRDWLQKRAEQGARSAWRRLLLVVRAKLEIIADGGSTFEREFLADILLPDGRTVHKALAEQLERSYLDGGMPKLLGPGSGE